MKVKNIIYLFLISLFLVNCSSQEEQITEKYINENLEELFANSNCSVKISNWKKHPIDTITKGEIYDYYIFKFRRKAEYSRELRDASLRVVNSIDGVIRSSRRCGVSYNWILPDKRKAENDYYHYSEEYNNLRELIEFLQDKTDREEVFIYVYPFLTELSSVDEFTEEKISATISCYSYIASTSGEVITILFGDEYERDLSRVDITLLLNENEQYLTE